MAWTSDAGNAAASETGAAPVEPAVPAPVRASRTLAALGLLALVGLGLAWELVLAPTGSGMLALKVLPLMLAVPGLLRYRLGTYRWLSLLVWLYVAEGLVRATSEAGPARALATAEVALALGVFAACVLQVRSRLQGKAR